MTPCGLAYPAPITETGKPVTERPQSPLWVFGFFALCILMAGLWLRQEEPYHQGVVTNPWQNYGYHRLINVQCAVKYGYAESVFVGYISATDTIWKKYYGIRSLNQWVPAESIGVKP
jgi:hypothetical protein